jgi:hypothetical protein
MGITRAWAEDGLAVINQRRNNPITPAFETAEETNLRTPKLVNNSRGPVVITDPGSIGRGTQPVMMQPEMLASVWSSGHGVSAGINKSLPVRTMLPDTLESHLNEPRGKSSYQNVSISCAESPMYPVDKETKTTVGMGELKHASGRRIKEHFQSTS